MRKIFAIAAAALASNVLEIVIPEPGQVLLLGSGVVGLAVLGRSRMKS